MNIGRKGKRSKDCSFGLPKVLRAQEEAASEESKAPVMEEKSWEHITS